MTCQEFLAFVQDKTYEEAWAALQDPSMVIWGAARVSSTQEERLEVLRTVTEKVGVIKVISSDVPLSTILSSVLLYSMDPSSENAASCLAYCSDVASMLLSTSISGLLLCAYACMDHLLYSVEHLSHGAYGPFTGRVAGAIETAARLISIQDAVTIEAAKATLLPGLKTSLAFATAAWT
jgi:hypothetical protein